MSNVALIERMYACVRARDHDGFRALCAPDLEWIQNPGFPGGSTQRGADAVIANVFGSFARDWESWRFRPDEMHELAGGVLVVGAYIGTARASGRAMEAQTAHLYDIHAGRIARFRQFTDTKTVWDALGGQP